MGTNYYLTKQNGEICPHCGRANSTERLHIGKSSAGWCFSLHVYPEKEIHDLADWLPLFESCAIEDEYDKRVSPKEMIQAITNRSHPRGLSRSRVGQYGCVSNGPGTWDCLNTDFS
jgi:hypothetical protein